MKSWKNRKTLLKLTELQPMALSTLAATSEAAPNPAPPSDMIDWLAQLTLLHGVPFEYIVPYSALLPPESIRFFYIDNNWLDRLIDGAISVGVASTQDNDFNRAWYQALYDEVTVQRGNVRAQLQGKPFKASTTSTISGFLFRSVVVAGWPGIEIKATAQGVELPILRMDRLSSTVLLCLFSGVPDAVEFIEPGEGLHFGLLDGQQSGSTEILVRGLGLPESAPLPAGEQIQDPSTPGGYLTAPASFRSGSEPGVVQISDLQQSIKTAITSDKVPGKPGAAALPNGEVTPAAFAIQMVRGAGLTDYTLPTGGA